MASLSWALPTINLVPDPRPTGNSGACVQSAACPGDRRTASDRPAPSSAAWIFVVRSPRLRPVRGSGLRGEVIEDGVDEAGLRAPADRRAHVIPLGRWAAGPLGRWAAGPLGCWHYSRRRVGRHSRYPVRRGRRSDSRHSQHGKPPQNSKRQPCRSPLSRLGGTERGCPSRRTIYHPRMPRRTAERNPKSNSTAILIIPLEILCR